MDEDWRVEVDLHEEHHSSGFLGRLLQEQDDESGSVAADVSRAFAQRVVVSRDGPVVFVYPHDESEAHRAVVLIHDLLRRHGFEADVKLTRWHPDEESWENATLPVPRTEAEHAAEHQKEIRRERDATERTHSFQFDVLVTLRHHGQARELAEKLAAEGMPVSRRWRYVVAGAADEDAAEQLADRIRSEAPADATVAVWTAKNLHDSVEYVSELAADNPFVLAALPRG